MRYLKIELKALVEISIDEKGNKFITFKPLKNSTKYNSNLEYQEAMRELGVKIYD